MAIEIRGLSPLLQVFDMPTSLHFYRDTIGFEVVNKSPGEGDQVDWVLLRLNDSVLMLNTAYESDDRPATPDPMRVASHRDTGIYFGCPDVNAAYEHFRTHGFEVDKPAVTQYGYLALTLTDPDGYSLTFHWPVGNEA